MNKAAARYYLIVLYQSSFTSASFNTITRKPVQQQLQKEANESAHEPMKSLTVSVASHFEEVLSMILLLMEDSMNKYPAQQKPPIPAREEFFQMRFWFLPSPEDLAQA